MAGFGPNRPRTPNGLRFERTGGRPVAGGLNQSRDSLLVADGQAAESVNIDHDRESARVTGGTVKIGNQVAPRSALLCSGRGFDHGLEVLPGKSAPSRGAAMAPWNPNQDIGATLSEELHAQGPDPDLPVYHTQRGSNFDISGTFRVPADERIFKGGEVGQLHAPFAAYETVLGGEVALDEFTAFMQKGGDGATPMSWAIGMVNTGDLFDIEVDGAGNNIFGIQTSTFAERQSNYALCFMWLDAPKVGVTYPVQMRYLLSNGQVMSDDVASVAPSNGAYCTMAYRSFIVPYFVLPGRNYSVSLALTRDTGTADSGATGSDEPTTSWNDDGVIRCAVTEEGDAGSGLGATIRTYEYDQFNPGASSLFRYKGPSDSLEYFSKYGVRWHGKDGTFFGLGYRFAPWCSAGFIPFGIDSAPMERGGFKLVDQSVHRTLEYGENGNPDADDSTVGGPAYFMRVSHDAAADPNGKVLEVSDQGLVQNVLYGGGVQWGESLLQWAQISPAGRSPWSAGFGVPGFRPFDEVWRGLGGDRAGLAWGGHNPEALRSYRVVMGASGSSVGFSNQGAAGTLVSIESFDTGPAYGGVGNIYNQHFVLEGANGFNWSSGAGPTFNTVGAPDNNFGATIRAFRWYQRPVILSDWRIYSAARDYDNDLLGTYISLERMPDLDDANEPGINDLVAWWPLDDGEEQAALREPVGGNNAHRIPFVQSTTTDGTAGQEERMLSGEGEAYQLDLSDNPAFGTEFRRALENGRSGFAVQLTFRMPEAHYGIPINLFDSPLGAASDRWFPKFAPRLFTWEVKDGPNSGYNIAPSPLLEFGHNTQLTGNAAGQATDWRSPFRQALGFGARFSSESDQEDPAFFSPLLLEAWQASGANCLARYADGDWVGKTITVQVGIEPTATAEVYTAYIAWKPKNLLLPETGDTPDSEFAYFSQFTVDRRTLERSVLTVGGVRAAAGLSALEHSSRVILDEVRWFGVSAPGNLPALSGEESPIGAGKIVGRETYPIGELDEDDILLPVPPLQVELGSTRFLPPPGESLIASEPSEVLKSINRSLILIEGEVDEFSRDETLPVQYQRFYFVESATSTAGTFANPYGAATRRAAAAKSFRLLGYCSFTGDTLDKALQLGRGAAFDSLASTVEDAAVSPQIFPNPTPLGGSWTLRAYTPYATGESRQVEPKWERGAPGPNRSPILGVHGLGERRFAMSQGSLFEIDDRWRLSGPTPELQNALAFRSKIDKASGVPLPLAKDYIVRKPTTVDNPAQDLSIFGPGTLVYDTTFPAPLAINQPVLDYWVNIDEYVRYGTLSWWGTGRSETQVWARLNRGAPELVVGSTDNVLGGSAPPSDNLYVARADIRIPLGQDVHIRWVMPFTDTDLGIPLCYVQGRQVSVSVNAVGNTATAGQWIPRASFVDDQINLYFMIGACPEFELVDTESSVFTAPSSIPDRDFPSPRLGGYIHSLTGRLNTLCISTFDTGAGGGIETGATFNPKTVVYDGAPLNKVYCFLNEEQDRYGVGHRLWDSGSELYVTIQSHGLISLAHDLGLEQTRPTFENYEGEVYVANGKRVRIIDQDNGVRVAGILPPQSPPEFEVVRESLWKTNDFDAGGLATNNVLHQVDTTTAAAVAYHQNNPGSMVITEAFDATMNWERDDYFAFKCYINFRSVSGRIPLYSRRGSLRSGQCFLECRDGKAVFGWFDTALKKEVYVETSKAVFRPGFDHYVYVRKWFPRGGTPTATAAQLSDQESNWQNSFFNDSLASAGEAPGRDMLVVRRFARESQGGVYDDWVGFDAKASIDYPGGSLQDWATNGSSARACVSFTSEDRLHTLLVAGTDVYTVTGLVAVFAPSTAAADIITLTGAGGARFLLDHVGMLLQITQGARVGEVFRIVEVLDNGGVPTQCRVVTQDGSLPGLIAGDVAAGQVVIATGVNLVKSEDFDASLEPDRSEFGVEILGSSLAGDPVSGIARCNAEMWGFAYVSAEGRDFAAAGVFRGVGDIFEDTAPAGGVLFSATPRCASGADVGTDWFGRQDPSTVPAAPATQVDLPWSGRPAGELEVDATFAWMAVDTRPYEFASPPVPVAIGSTQPASDPPALTRDTTAASSADCQWTDIGVGAIQGERRLLMRFYDPERGVESASSPLVRLNPASEEPNNPSRGHTLLLSNLATPLEGDRKIHRRFYLSTAGGLSLFLVGTLENPEADTFAIHVDNLVLPSDVALDITVAEPPRAHVIGVHDQRMFYGDLPGSPDGIGFSDPSQPEVVRADPVLPSIFALEAGQSKKVTAMISHGGEMVAFKRDSIVGLRFVGGAISQRKISEQEGCVAAQTIVDFEDRVYYCSPRGMSLLLLDQIGRAYPFYIGRNTDDLFSNVVDPTELENVSAAYNGARNQIVLTFKARGRLWTDQRLVTEFDHPLSGPAQTNQMVAGHRFSTHEGPNGTAVGEAQNDADCTCAVIVGTEEGFVAWLNRKETRTVMAHPDVRAFGSYVYVHRTNGNFRRSADNALNRTDFELEGMRGTVLRWLDRSDPDQLVEKEAVVIAAFPNVQEIRFLLWGPDGTFQAPTFPDGSVLPNDPPGPDTLAAEVTVGAMLPRFKSKFFDIVTPDLEKIVYHLQLTRRPEELGTAKVDVFADLSDDPVDTYDLDLTQPFDKQNLQGCLQSVHAFAYRIRLETPTVDVGFELLDAIFQYQITERE